MYRLPVFFLTLLFIWPCTLLADAGSSASSSAEPDMQAPSAQVYNQGLEELVALLAQIKSIAGTFVQFAVDQKGVTIQESRGSFKAKRPDYFFWRTDAPLEQEVYTDGKTVSVYDPDLEQATIQPSDEKERYSPAILFSGNTEMIATTYQVETQHLDGKYKQFILSPLAQESLFEKMRLRFEGNRITEMRIRDSLGQESTISFIQTEINLEIPDSDFEAKFPPGTDIIEDIPVRRNVP